MTLRFSTRTLAAAPVITREEFEELIARVDGRRKATVSSNVADGYNLGEVAAAVRAVAEPLVTRAGCTLSVGGQFEAQQSATRTLLTMGAFVVLVMLMLVQTALGSLRAALLVMVNLPLALIGGVVAVFLTEGAGPVDNTLALLGISGARYEAPVLSIASILRLVTLFAVAVRRGILPVRP